MRRFRVSARWKSFLARSKREEGFVTIEFLLWFPLFFAIFLWTVDLSILLTRATHFDRALDIAIRDVRLGIGGPMDYDRFKQRVCDEFGFPNRTACLKNITVEMQPIDANTFAPLPQGVACRDRKEDIDPVLEFDPGASNELMLVRACMYIKAIIPVGTSYALKFEQDEFGGVRIFASSAFVNEPR